MILPMGMGSFLKSSKSQVEIIIKYDEICILPQFQILGNFVKIHVRGPLLLCKLA